MRTPIHPQPAHILSSRLGVAVVNLQAHRVFNLEYQGVNFNLEYQGVNFNLEYQGVNFNLEYQGVNFNLEY